jgi:uncharacterized membrane protein AbrB (regulator of aidB expression)
MLIAFVGGAMFDLGRFPAGWMTRSPVFIAIAALNGRKIYVPTAMTRIFFRCARRHHRRRRHAGDRAWDSNVASYAPGLVDLMTILALALHLDPVFAGAHHVACTLVVSSLLPIAVRLTDPRTHEPHALPPPLETAHKILENQTLRS